MKQSLFEQRNQEQWLAFDKCLEQLESNQHKIASSQNFTLDYRRLCQQLALARERGYSNHLVDRLQQLVLRGHQQLYRHHRPTSIGLLGFLLVDLPCQVRQQWRLMALACLLFFGSLTLMGMLTYCFPELIYSLMGHARVNEMEAMYDPQASRLGRFAERGADQDWYMFGYYIMNNISIAFQTFASGLLFGIGSIFYLLFNGLMIGAVAGYLTQLGHGETFWSFVIGHAAFELTAIAMAGAAGLSLGSALLCPGRRPRAEALRLAAIPGIRLLGGAALFLLIAAFIEAYWSSMTFSSSTIKYWVGAALWLLLIAYLTLAGRGLHAPD